MIVFGTQPSAGGTTMTTTVEAVSGSTQKIHHRGIVALGVAAILAVGGVSAGIAVAANNDSSPAPTHVVPSTPLPGTLLRVGGPR
jgi:hypothetical protein